MARIASIRRAIGLMSYNQLNGVRDLASPVEHRREPEAEADGHGHYLANVAHEDLERREQQAQPDAERKLEREQHRKEQRLDREPGREPDGEEEHRQTDQVVDQSDQDCGDRQQLRPEPRPQDEEPVCLE